MEFGSRHQVETFSPLLTVKIQRPGHRLRPRHEVGDEKGEKVMQW